MATEKKIRFAIILYDSRSGSTFLASLLSQYNGLKVCVESSFPRLLLEQPFRQVTGQAELSNILDKLFSEIQFRDMHLNRSILENYLAGKKSPLASNDIFEAILKLYFQGSTCNELESEYTYVLKIPIAHEFLNSLETLIPGYKIIHIIRDGRAVFSSKRNSVSLKEKVFEKNLLVAAIGWKRKLRKAGLASQPILNIRYEDLVTQNERTLMQVLDFLEITGAGRLKTKTTNEFVKIIGEKQKSFHTNLGKNPQQQNITKWMEDMAKREIFLYEKITSKELRKFEYDIYELKKGDPIRYLSASLLYVYYIFHYVFDRSRNLFRALLKGQHQTLIRRKLIQSGILQPQ